MYIYIYILDILLIYIYIYTQPCSQACWGRCLSIKDRLARVCMYGAGAPIIAESSGAFAAGCFPDTQVVESPGPKITLEAQRSMDYSQDAQDPAAFMRGATDLCLKRPRDSASPARSFGVKRQVIAPTRAPSKAHSGAPSRALSRAPSDALSHAAPPPPSLSEPEDDEVNAEPSPAKTRDSCSPLPSRGVKDCVYWKHTSCMNLEGLAYAATII